MNDVVKTERRLIPGYGDLYQIDENGTVYSDSQEKEVWDNNGIPTVILFNNKKKAVYNVNNLMKAAFPEKYPPIENLEGEEWKPVPDWPEIMVSNYGRVKNVAQTKYSNLVKYTEQESLRKVDTRPDHPLFTLPAGAGKLTIAPLVYRLFINDNIPKKPKILFRDGNTKNLHVSNLYIE